MPQQLKAGQQDVGRERCGFCIQDDFSVLSDRLTITVRESGFSQGLGYLFIPSDRGGC